MTQDEITAGLEIAEKATSGPWYAFKPYARPHRHGSALSTLPKSHPDEYTGRLMDAGDFAGSCATIDDNDAAFIAASRTLLPKALEALQRVYEVHDHFTEAENLWCRACGLMWPCATIRAIEGAAE